jgi:putative nucleotidyltransferase with HDIG domain
VNSSATGGISSATSAEADRSALMLRDNLDRIDSVPMLPAMVGRLLTMMDDPHTNAYQIARVVANDQSLVSSILRIINSAYYGFMWRIKSVNQAIVLLGFRSIRNLVLAATVMSTYGGNAQADGFDRTLHWKHSIATAFATDMLAKQWAPSLKEDAFLAGLVHDIGRVIMDQHFPKEFGLAYRLVHEGNVPLGQAESTVFKLSHAEIGRHVARKWSFPGDIVAAIGDHHGPDDDAPWPHLAALVHVADMIVHGAGLGLGAAVPTISPEALEVLNKQSDALEEMQERFADAHEKMDIFDGLIA